ncbi:hypothetical protein GLYMA_02G108450v4 [Glycine max]|nr:hypothetical protein GLYMA_02G108450v4 [Glycine max]KAH1059767.1 hypothetical protein GYH30_003657 [Glycine max]
MIFIQFFVFMITFILRNSRSREELFNTSNSWILNLPLSIHQE